MVVQELTKKENIMEEQKLEEKVMLNGNEMTKTQFEEEKKKLLEKKVELVEVSSGVYKTRLKD